MKKPLLLGIILTVCVVIVAFVFAQVYPVGMISYWKFEEGEGTTASDSVDENHGTLFNEQVWTTGQVGGALSFDGVDDYVTIPSTGLSSNPMAISWWMNTDDMSAVLFMDKDNWAATEGMEIWLYNDSGGYGYLNVRGSGGTNVASSSDFHGGWVHVAVVFDGATAKIYRNGVFDTSGPINQITTSTKDFIMGMYPGLSDWYLNGIIDEVAIYNRILTPEEIHRHYQDGLHGLGYDVECVPPPSSMVSWWPGDGDATDILGGNDGNLMNGADFTVGRVGQAFYLDGADDYVEVPDATNLSIPGSFTVDAWVRLDELKYISTILTKEHNALPFDVNYNLHILDYKMFFALTFDAGASLLTGSGGCDAGGCYVRGATTLTSSNLGQFLHVAAVYDDTTKTLTVFLNGVKDGEATFSTSGKPMTNVEPIRIGRRNYSSAGTYFNGVIDELELYDRALPASEIQAIYLVGSAGKCKITNQPPIAVCKDIETDAGENCQASIDAADIDGGSSDPDEGDTITLSINNIDPLPLGENWVILTVTDESGEYDTCQAKVTVVDKTPPEISISFSPDTLRPPNHKMILITPTIIASDNCDPDSELEVVLISITMDEGDDTDAYHPDYDSTLGDGHTTNDIQVMINGDIYLRAERSGKGDGRIYEITYEVRDASGNSATATATVTVPHDKR